jgi:putative ABC transport system permease protein
MSPWRKWLAIGRRNVQADVDDELRFHLEMQTRDLIASGLSPDAARREAERRFGAVPPVRAALVAGDRRRDKRTRLREWLGELMSDLRFAARTLRRTPFFTAMAVLCIGLGIGVTSTIFTAVYGILLRPLPYARADELVAVYTRQVATGEGRINVGWHDFLAWREQSRSFAQLGLWTWNSFAISGTGEAERLEGASVTTNLFPLLGVAPILGRHFTPDEEQPGGNTVILLGHGLWERRYGADRSIVGQSISLDGVPHTVVGVMPPGFAFPERGQAWVPYVPDAAALNRANRFLAGAIGRLRPGVTLAAATVEMEQISRRLEQDFPDDNRGWAADLVPLREDLVGDLRRPLQVFGVAVSFVLLIACANVAGLMLTRGVGRARELAVRASLGAQRSRLVRQLLTESVMIGALGGVVGWGLAVLGVRALRLGFPDSVPFFISLEVDRTALLFTLLLSLLVGFLFGMLPALRSTHLDLASAVKEGGRGSEGAQRTRGRRTLIVAEIALTMVLMIGAGLLLRSYRALADTDLGFRPENALTARIALPLSRYEARDRRGVYFQEVLDRIQALPGVEQVGSAQGIPFSGWNVKAYMVVEGKPPHPPGEELDVHYQYLTPGYFDAIEATIVRGRGFTPADRDSVNPVGIINESFARLEFRGEDPIGRRVKMGDLTSDDPWISIVGVVRDFRHYRLPSPMGPAIYLPYFSRPVLAQTLVVRTSGDPLTLVAPLQAAVYAIDPDVPVYQVQTMEQAMSRSLWLQRAPTQVVTLFAVLAMILAAVGLYGVIAYSVTQRTRELGVRMTLGATTPQVVGLVLRQALRLSAAGIGLGLAGAVVLTRFLQPLLYQVSLTDRVTFVGVPLLLVLVTFVAAWAPARRAGRVDPVEAIKAE